MSTLGDICSKVERGEHLSVRDCSLALEHYTELTKQLARSGPLFALATLQSNSIEGKLRLFADVHKYEAKSADRASR